MFESIVNLIKSIFANSNIRCYFRSNCCNKNQASEPIVCSREPQEIKSKISRIIHLWNMKEKHRNIDKIKVAGELCSAHERLILSALVPWRKIITV